MGTNREFIEGLATIVRNGLKWDDHLARCGVGDGARCCPMQFGVCGHGTVP